MELKTEGEGLALMRSLHGRLLRCLLRQDLQAVVGRGCRWRRGNQGDKYIYS